MAPSCASRPDDLTMPLCPPPPPPPPLLQMFGQRFDAYRVLCSPIETILYDSLAEVLDDDDDMCSLELPPLLASESVFAQAPNACARAAHARPAARDGAAGSRRADGSRPRRRADPDPDRGVPPPGRQRGALLPGRRLQRRAQRDAHVAGETSGFQLPAPTMNAARFPDDSNR